jgi:MFS family permease
MNEISARKQKILFSGIEFTVYAAIGATGYGIQYLKSLGNIGPGFIGFVIALNALMSTSGQIFWGVIADKLGSGKKTIILSMILAIGVTLSIPLLAPIKIGEITVAAFIIPLVSFFVAACTPLIDNWLLAIIKKNPEVNFGTIRMFGSLGAVFTGLVFFLLTRNISAAQQSTSFLSTYYAFTVLTIPMLIVTSLNSEKEVIAQKKASLKEMNIARLFKDYYYMIFLIFCAGVFMAMTVGNFHVYLISEIAGDEALKNTFLFNSIKSVTEMIALMLSPLLVRKLGSEKMLKLICGLYVFEMVYFAICSSITMVMIGYIFSGALYGTVLPAIIIYTGELAPTGLETTAQSVRGGLFSLTMVVGGILGGQIVNSFGVRGYYLVCGALSVIGLAIFYFALNVGKKKGLKKQSELIISDKN